MKYLSFILLISFSYSVYSKPTYSSIIIDEIISVDGAIITNKMLELGLAKIYYGGIRSSWCN